MSKERPKHKSIVYIEGNHNRSAGFGLAGIHKRFDHQVSKLIGGKVKRIKSVNFTKVPVADIYISHSRGCSRANLFGAKKSTKLCVDDYQRGNGKASDKNHYILTKALRAKIKSIL